MNKKNNFFVNCYGKKKLTIITVYKWQSMNQVTMKQMQILKFFYFNDDFLNGTL